MKLQPLINKACARVRVAPELPLPRFRRQTGRGERKDGGVGARRISWGQKSKENKEAAGLHSFILTTRLIPADGLAGQVVEESTSRAINLGFIPSFGVDLYLVRVIPDLEIGDPVATLPGIWLYRVSAGTGWPSISTLSPGEVEGLICSFHLSVTSNTIVKQIRP